MDNSHCRHMMILVIWACLLTSGCSRNEPVEPVKSAGNKNEKSNAAPQIDTKPVLHTDDDLNAIVAKVVKAYGGEKAFSRWRCGGIKYKPRGTIIPEEIGGIILEDNFQLPGQYKRVNRMRGKGIELVQIWVQNHGTIWQKNGNEEAKILENNKGWPGTTHEYLTTWNLPVLFNEGKKLTKSGEESIDRRATVVIRAEVENGLEFYWLFRF